MEIAVLLIIYKSDLNVYEKVSLTQCIRIFKDRKVIVVKPVGLDISCLGDLVDLNKISVRNFPDRYFVSVASYNKLLLSRGFYRAFKSYDYILIYQLDCFVFHDVLDDWVQKGYSYVGAPWFEGKEYPQDRGNVWGGVGNGGFSLRKVGHHLQVLHSFARIKSFREVASDMKLGNFNWIGKLVKLPTVFRYYLFHNNSFFLLNRFNEFEDKFWGLYAKRGFTWFKVPDEETAIQFSMESKPRYLYTMNNYRLPFGCHAWEKYDFEFWKPFIESYGFKLNYDQ